MQKMMYLLVSQHVASIIMHIIRRMVQKQQRLWYTALVVLQKTRGEAVVGVHLLGMVSCTCWEWFHHSQQVHTNHLFSTSLLQHNQCCTPQALSILYHSPDDGHDDARSMLRRQ
jgi:hypothetical protein